VSYDKISTIAPVAGVRSGSHVLIGFAEAIPAPEVLFSLRSAGHRISVFTRKRGLPLERLSPERIIVLPAPEIDIAAAADALRAVMTGPEVPDLILPLDDASLWLIDAALGEDPRIVGATGARVRFALDKALQITAARAAGLTVAPTLVVRKPEDLDVPFDLPAIAKPSLAVQVNEGRLSKGSVKYLLTLGDVASLRGQLTKSSGEMEPLLVQSLITGVGEGIFGHATPEGVTAWSGHRRLRMMNPHGSGASACISAVPDLALRKAVSRFVLGVGWRGPFMMEFLRDADGTAWFMELNGRMWGSMALARRQGFEYPAWSVAASRDLHFSPVVFTPLTSPQVVRNLGRDVLHLAFLLRGPRSQFHVSSWPRFWRSFFGVMRPAHPRAFYNYDPAHRTFFLHEALWTIRRALRR
jgi:hypothetical protein